MGWVQQATGLLLVAFMVGNLLGLGLDLRVRETVGALRHTRFVFLTVLWGWVLGPVCAWAVVQVIPMQSAHATGLLLLSLAPAAPFAPPLALRAGGDAAHVGAVMLLTALGTVLVMPLAVPAFVPGLSTDPMTIGKPLLYYVLIPMGVGLAVRTVRPGAAATLRPHVKTVTTIATLLLLLALLAQYGGDMMAAIGSFAIGAQVLYFGLLFAGAYSVAPGLAREQRIALSLAMGTRNIGAAFAPLVAVPGTDPQALVSCAIATVVTFALAALASTRFARPSGAVAAAA